MYSVVGMKLESQMLLKLGKLNLPSIDPFEDINPMPRSDDVDFLVGSNTLEIGSDDQRAAEYIKGLNAVNDNCNSDSDDQE